MKIAVLGAGAWGTALAIAFSRRHEAALWARDAAQAAAMRAGRENARYLPGAPLPPALRIESDFSIAASSELNILATPLSGLRDTLRRLRAAAPATPLLWVCKGLEAGSQMLPHQIVAAELGEGTPCGALTGPSFAEEVARGLPTAITLAAADAGFAEATAQVLHDARLRVYANPDVVGAEVGGAVKNVMAIAAGISDGMGFGLNARAALITRGLAEITRLGLALGGKRETFMGLAGMGDLILTCTGDLSRNRRVGLALAKGLPLEQILRELGHTAEGVSSAREVAVLAGRLGVDMPITRAVHGILYENVPASTAVEQLLGRDPKPETA
ncbi:MAG: NAD(P)-dependent glycerol-3-phosphate dehydrogenase [Rhodocyclaceae bacterium]|jgi:glycerol-3-phosphate dehydrogenase (NAD(P)+)|nr:NAD(P)-dependent glycerol-3-phosphate dehydrogenase [Rhodocyclaceae bacterium]MCC6878328.1 NAD(P)-dependent glycerol-3-phosphate dehydrogenase [Rhodocyclaceae bacterium]MCL4681922.1 NAD(P)-dependent glycerol-3-phosphate dehydrogenase [Rhodocyclaceae bacterium]